MTGLGASAAWRAWRRGDVETAAASAYQDERTFQRTRLLFLTSYVQGRYREALDQLGFTAGRRVGRRLVKPVAEALLHLDEPHSAAAHLRRHRRAIPPDLAARVERPPRIDLRDTTVLPFADHPLAPHLPGVVATVNGQRVVTHLDTGGTFVVMGTERAASLGVDLTPNGRHHHGTTRTAFYTGTVRELRLGDAALTNVPVEATPSLAGDQDVVLIGTNLLQHLLTTIDFPGQRLLVSPRGDEAARTHHDALLTAPAEPTRVPFYLWDDHFMFARGGFGPRDDLNFFVDSGLVYVVRDSDDAPARQACLCTTSRDYQSFGVPRQQTTSPHFETDTPVRLGPLAQSGHLLAVTPSRRPPWRSFGGVRIDGLISHAFLSAYAWTIDFDRHEYRFG